MLNIRFSSWQMVAMTGHGSAMSSHAHYSSILSKEINFDTHFKVVFLMLMYNLRFLL